METAPAQLTASATGNTAVIEGAVDASPRAEVYPVSLKPERLRLMCSYGGHIVPRPHDKTLYYVGGDTRIIVIDRRTSLSELHQRLPKTLLNSEAFTLKYQLPDEDLDSLITVSTDEDFENMVEECERLNNVNAKHGRLRLFMFPKSPSNIDHILIESGSAKSDDWFFNALNGKTSSAVPSGASDRGVSQSSSINNLLGLDDETLGKSGIGGKDVERQAEGSKIGGAVSLNHDLNSIPDSPMRDTSSSFGSTSSSPSMASLPPIKVHVEENSKFGSVLGIEGQFQQMRVAEGGNVNMVLPQKTEEQRIFVTPTVPGAVASGLPVMFGDEYTANRAFSDDERSDHGGFIRVQVQGQSQMAQQPAAQIHQKPVTITDLPSPDSVSSEGSARNPLSVQTKSVHQESNTKMQTGNSVVTSDMKIGDPNSIKFQGKPQLQEHGYIVSGHYDQNRPPLHYSQQFVHAGNPYFPTGAMPVASYYPVFPSQQQNHPHQPLLDQQVPLYFMSARPTQPYNLQATYSEMPPSSDLVHPSGPPSKHELSSGVYRSSVGPTSHLIQLPSGQHQSQFLGYSQVSQQTPSFTYELPDPTHPHVYYTQPLPHPPPQMSSHYQTLTTSHQIPNASTQLPAAPQP